MRWVLGLNKYSHDAGCALLSCDGRHSIIVPNERISRIKHEGGDTAAAVRHALDAVGASHSDIVLACANNHHHRVAAFERRLPWSVDLGLYPKSTLADDNLLPGVPKHEHVRRGSKGVPPSSLHQSHHACSNHPSVLMICALAFVWQAIAPLGARVVGRRAGAIRPWPGGGDGWHGRASSCL